MVWRVRIKHEAHKVTALTFFPSFILSFLHSTSTFTLTHHRYNSIFFPSFQHPVFSMSQSYRNSLNRRDWRHFEWVFPDSQQKKSRATVRCELELGGDCHRKFTIKGTEAVGILSDRVHQPHLKHVWKLWSRKITTVTDSIVHLWSTGIGRTFGLSTRIPIRVVSDSSSWICHLQIGM